MSVESGLCSMDSELLAPDQFHPNDLSYRCLGDLLADAIGSGLDQAAGRGAVQRIKSAHAR